MLSTADLESARATVESRMVHRVAVERTSALVAGTPPTPVLDDYSQPVVAWLAIATVPAFIVEKSAREVALLNQGGAVISTLTIGVPTETDLTTADRLHHDPANCPVVAGEIVERRFQIHNVRDAVSELLYLRCDATVVE